MDQELETEMHMQQRAAGGVRTLLYLHLMAAILNVRNRTLSINEYFNYIREEQSCPGSFLHPPRGLKIPNFRKIPLFSSPDNTP